MFAAIQSEINGEIDINIAQFMNNWIWKEGYPLLDVKVNENRTQAHITQKRFLLKNATHNDNSTWEIPITYTHSTENVNFSNTRPSSIFSSNPDHTTHVIKFEEEIDWLILNVQQTGNCSHFIYLDLNCVS